MSAPRTLAELVKQVQAGEPNSHDVFLDWLLEQGMARSSAVDVVNGVSLGSFVRPRGSRLAGVPSIVRTPTLVELDDTHPFTFYDTINVTRPGTFLFFRDLEGKSEAQTNCWNPRRIRIGDRFLIRRITLEGPKVIEGRVQVRINRRPFYEGAAAALMVRGFWGAPLQLEIQDNDDIFVDVEMVRIESIEQDLPVPLRFTFHGWRREPVGR